jgi:hypothetical protein
MDASSLDLPAGFVVECVPMPFGLATEAEWAVAYALALDPADAVEMARDIVSMSAEDASRSGQSLTDLALLAASSPALAARVEAWRASFLREKHDQVIQLQALDAPTQTAAAALSAWLDGHEESWQRAIQFARLSADQHADASLLRERSC